VNTQAIVQGTLKADGTLELDQKPSLAPGRVQVVLQAIAARAATRTGLAEVLQQIQQGQMTRGYPGRTAAEMAAEEVLRQQENDDYEARCQALWGQTQTGQPH